MAKTQGRFGKVTLGGVTVAEQVTWSMDGITTDQLDSAVFGDNWKEFEFGRKDGGTVTFNGFLDITDETGQQALLEAQVANTNITNLELFINSTSKYVPNQTAGYFSPFLTTGADTPASYVNITGVTINNDSSALATINFTAKVSGVMVLV